MKSWISVLILLLASGALAEGPADRDSVPSRTATGKVVTVRTIPASWALIRDVRGDYALHPRVFEELMQYVGANFRAVGDCFGIYPTDPDATKKENVRWQVGVRIASGTPLGY